MDKEHIVCGLLRLISSSLLLIVFFLFQLFTFRPSSGVFCVSECCQFLLWGSIHLSSDTYKIFAYILCSLNPQHQHSTLWPSHGLLSLWFMDSYIPFIIWLIAPTSYSYYAFQLDIQSIICCRFFLQPIYLPMLLVVFFWLYSVISLHLVSQARF